MKKFLCLSLAVFVTIFFGCMSDGTDTIVLLFRSSSSIESSIPSSPSDSSNSSSSIESSIPSSPSDSSNSSSNNDCAEWKWKVTTSATCETPDKSGIGIETKTCTSDTSITDSTREIPKLEWGEWIQTSPSGCGTKGSKTRSCYNPDLPPKEQLIDQEWRPIDELPPYKPKPDTTKCVNLEQRCYPFYAGKPHQGYETVVIGDKTWFKRNLNDSASGSRCYGENAPVYKTSNYYTCDATNLKTFSDLEIQDTCKKYGRLYDWATAMDLPSKCNDIFSTSDVECAIKTPYHKGICPDSSHIPSLDEFKSLWSNNYCFKDSSGECWEATISPPGRCLKEDSDYWGKYDGKPGKGTDNLGFSALPGGEYLPDESGGHFCLAGGFGFWWTASTVQKYTIDSEDNRKAYNIGIALWSDNVEYRHEIKSNFYSVRCVKD